MTKTSCNPCVDFGVILSLEFRLAADDGLFVGFSSLFHFDLLFVSSFRN
jgi:hypothetical protein